MGKDSGSCLFKAVRSWVKGGDLGRSGWGLETLVIGGRGGAEVPEHFSEIGMGEVQKAREGQHETGSATIGLEGIGDAL